jgi:lysozyme
VARGRRGRRWLVAGAATLVVAVVGAVVGRYVWLPTYRPGIHSGERYGIDVSNYQGQIDWNAVRRDGIRFAYMKATEGGDFTDAHFAANWAGAGAAGVDRGAYHYFTLCTPGATQAANFLHALALPLSAESHRLAPAVDLELAGNCRQRPDLATVDRELTTFLSVVEAQTHTPTVLYVGEDFGERYPASSLLHRPRWRLRFLRRPHGDWVVWQVDGLAHVNGIHGKVDLDVMRP